MSATPSSATRSNPPHSRRAERGTPSGPPRFPLKSSPDGTETRTLLAPQSGSSTVPCVHRRGDPSSHYWRFQAAMKNTCIRFLGIVLALGGACLLSVAADEKEAVASIHKQADDMTKKDWAAASKAGEAIAKKHELEDIMYVMKLRRANPRGAGFVGGLGIGGKPGAITPDGIEAKITRMTKSPMEMGELTKETPDLVRMAEITAAIASTAVHQCPVPAAQGQKSPAKWKELSEQMHKSSLELIDALKKKNPANVKESANRLNGTCTECHSTFRDDK